MAQVKGNVSLNVNISQVNANVPTANANQPPTTLASSQPTFTCSTSGVLADQVDTLYVKKGLSIPHATPVVLDLTALTDMFGNAINFARVKRIAIIMYGAVDGQTLSLGYMATTANAWTVLVSNPGQIPLQATPTATNQAFFAVAAPNATGYPVTSSSHLLELSSSADNSSGVPMTIDIFIDGCSALSRTPN